MYKNGSLIPSLKKKNHTAEIKYHVTEALFFTKLHLYRTFSKTMVFLHQIRQQLSKQIYKVHFVMHYCCFLIVFVHLHSFSRFSNIQWISQFFAEVRRYKLIYMWWQHHKLLKPLKNNKLNMLQEEPVPLIGITSFKMTGDLKRPENS